MKRTKKKKFKRADAILTADWHLQEKIPVCRTDDFIAAQWNKVRQVADLQKEHGCPVLHAGDLFDHWKPSPELLSLAIKNLPYNFHTVYGNHDLPQHSMELKHKCGVYTLATGGHVNIMKEGHWNVPPKEGVLIRYFNPDEELYGKRVAVWHKYVYTHKAPFPGVDPEDEGHKLLNDHPQFDLILTGDNHQSFICKQDDRLLVNAGSLMRITADQQHYEPCVWLYYAEDNEVEAHYLIINEDVVSREHIEHKENRDERIAAFVERLGSDWEASLNFKENLKKFERENNVDKTTMSIAYKAIDE